MSMWPSGETFQHSSCRLSNGHIKQTLQSVEELARLNRLGSRHVGDAFDCEEPIRDEPPCVPTSLRGPDTDEAEKMQVSPILQSQLHLDRSTVLVHGDFPSTAEQEQGQGGKGCSGDQPVWS